MHILVTGGCGYIGNVLIPKLLAKGYTVTAFDIMWFGNSLPEHENLRVVAGDVRDTDSVPLEGVDALVHLANVANDPCGDLSAKLVWEVNALATMNLIEKGLQHGLKQFLHASSGSVYGIKDEENVTEDLSLVPISDYNKTKMISERVIMSYSDRLVTQIIRPATVCGYSPRIRLDVSVNMLTMQALTNGCITVLGGLQTRPNIHIQDITDLFIYFLESGSTYTGVYNAGFENLSIMDIARLVTKHVPAEIVVKESNDPRSYRLNSDKLLATGFTPRFGVENAIMEIKREFEAGKLVDDDLWYNIRTMKKIQTLE